VADRRRQAGEPVVPPDRAVPFKKEERDRIPALSQRRGEAVEQAVEAQRDHADGPPSGQAAQAGADLRVHTAPHVRHDPVERGAIDAPERAPVQAVEAKILADRVAGQQLEAVQADAQRDQPPDADDARPGRATGAQRVPQQAVAEGDLGVAGHHALVHVQDGDVRRGEAAPDFSGVQPAADAGHQVPVS